MAVVRARSAPPYGLILFVFLTVVFAALAVVFYLQGAKADKDRADAVQSLSVLATPSELHEAEAMKSGNVTPVGYLLAQVKQDRADLEHTNAQLAQTTANLKLLQSDYDNAKNTLESLNTVIGQYKSDNEASIKKADDTIDQLKNELVQANTAMAAANQALQDATSKAENDLNTAKNEAEQDRRKNVLEIEQSKQLLTTAENKISVLQDEVKNLRPDIITAVGREPDGVITRTSTDTGEVYINLGKGDRLQPGQTFAVYDQKTGVRFSTDAEAQGKGSIEVLEVGPNESLCRVTFAVKGQAMEVGDLIANPVYHQDKTRQFHFVVIGDFDLDGDGVATAAEHDRLVRMIQAWGGVVDDNVSTQTDFLVAGLRPASPSAVVTGAEAPNGVVDARTKRQQSYDDILEEAKRSSVPILNQNRFLAMVGYYNTTVVHY